MFHRQSVFTLLISLTLLTGCSQGIEQRLAADPQLKEEENNSTATTPQTNTNGEASNSSNLPQEETTTAVLEPPENVPETIPFYPNAELVNREINPETTSGTLELTSGDAANVITSFYKQELSQDNWEVVTPLSATSEGNQQITARWNPASAQSSSSSLQLKVMVSEADRATSNILIEYQSLAEVKPETASSETASTKKFSDLKQTADPLERYVRDVAQLGILTPIESGSQRFAPNEVVTRRTFARWLFKANNLFYRDRPSQQIRPVQNANTPAFQDIPPSDPDFGMIQGLAEAGLIPSRLTADTTRSNFRPDAPLTRETLLLWKVPLDIRSRLPSGNVTTVKETWGFQDAGKIDPKALDAVVADFSNGEKSNLRRVYGYTQLFQPKKAVTRAEAAAALWLFGTQGEAISAKELIKDGS
jgi:hypothetical protein